MKKIYLAGSGGMLGEAFYNVFSKNYNIECSDVDLNDKWLNYLDFRDYKEYERAVIKFSPHYLFHIGAYTDLEFCELNPDDTYITNFISVQNAVKISNNLFKEKGGIKF